MRCSRVRCSCLHNTAACSEHDRVHRGELGGGGGCSSRLMPQRKICECVQTCACRLAPNTSDSPHDIYTCMTQNGDARAKVIHSTCSNACCHAVSESASCAARAVPLRTRNYAVQGWVHLFKLTNFCLTLDVEVRECSVSTRATSNSNTSSTRMRNTTATKATTPPLLNGIVAETVAEKGSNTML
jgi:hypothetical protein